MFTPCWCAALLLKATHVIQVAATAYNKTVVDPLVAALKHFKRMSTRKLAGSGTCSNSSSCKRNSGAAIATQQLLGTAPHKLHLSACTCASCSALQQNVAHCAHGLQLHNNNNIYHAPNITAAQSAVAAGHADSTNMEIIF